MELFKIARNNWNGQGHDKHPTDGAHAAYKLEIWSIRNMGIWNVEANLAKTWGGGNVAIANCCHGDHNPVDTGGDWSEPTFTTLFDEEAETRKDEPRDQNEHQHQAQLTDGLLKGEGNWLEPWWVTSQLENPGKFEYSENLNRQNYLVGWFTVQC